MRERKLLSIVLAVVLLASVTMVSGCSKPTETTTGGGQTTTTPPAETPITPPTGTSAVPTADSATTIPDGAAVYVIDKGSYIGWTGYKTGGQHSGQFIDFDGTVTVPGEDLSTAKINLTIGTASVETDDTILTSIMKGGSFFAVDDHPNATFVSTAIEKTVDGYNITGDLTIRGITNSVTFPAQMELAGDTIMASAEFKVDRHLWKIGEGWINVVQVVTPYEILDEALIEFDATAKAK